MFAPHVLKISSLVNFRFKNFLVVLHTRRTSVKRQTTTEDCEIRLDKFVFMNMYGLANDDRALDFRPRKSDKLLCWPLTPLKFSADVHIASHSQEQLYVRGSPVYFSPQTRHGGQFAGAIFVAFLNYGKKKKAPFQMT